MSDFKPGDRVRFKQTPTIIRWGAPIIQGAIAFHATPLSGEVKSRLSGGIY